MTDRETQLIRDLAALRSDPPDPELMGRIADDAALERTFAEARAHPPEPSELLLARIRRDARRRPDRSDAVALGGIVAAGLVGLVVGLSGVTSLPPVDTAYVLTPAYDFQLLAED